MKPTLAFDVYGTLIDTSGVYQALRGLVGKDAHAFMETWRNKQLEYSFRRGLMNAYVDFSICTQEALKFCCLQFHVNLEAEQQRVLLDAYTILPTFGDVPAALSHLQEVAYPMFAFSNGSAKAVTGLLENSGIGHFFQGVVSVESIKTFKPNPRVYQHFNDSTNSEKSNSFLISGNPFDVIGAVSYGMKAIWVQRSPAKVFDPWGITPTATIGQLTELKSVLDTF